jgi:hypothetical protein
MGFIGHMGEIRCATKFKPHKLERKHQIEDLGTNERTAAK